MLLQPLIPYSGEDRHFRLPLLRLHHPERSSGHALLQSVSLDIPSATRGSWPLQRMVDILEKLGSDIE